MIILLKGKNWVWEEIFLSNWLVHIDGKVSLSLSLSLSLTGFAAVQIFYSCYRISQPRYKQLSGCFKDQHYFSSNMAAMKQSSHFCYFQLEKCISLETGYFSLCVTHPTFSIPIQPLRLTVLHTLCLQLSVQAWLGSLTAAGRTVLDSMPPKHASFIFLSLSLSL